MGLFTRESAAAHYERVISHELKDITEVENEVIDARSREHFAANLFNTRAVELTDDEYQELRRRFEADYAECQSMVECLALFLDDEYFYYLNSLDLAKAKIPSDEILGQFRNEYREVRDTFMDAGVIEGELGREESGRTIHFRTDALSHEDYQSRHEIEYKWLIGERNRPLIQFRHNGYMVTILKRMTFAADAEYVQKHHLANEVGRVVTPEATKIMEKALDLGDPAIHPIRTLYYVKKSPIEDDSQVEEVKRVAEGTSL